MSRFDAPAKCPACLPLGSSHGPATGHNTARLPGSVAGLVLLAFTASRLFASLLREREVSSDTIVGRICVHLLLGLWFAISFTRYSRDPARSLSSAVFKCPASFPANTSLRGKVETRVHR
jgi:hypothetical protein